MRVRNSVFAAATIAALTLSWAGPAAAQGYSAAPAVALPATVGGEHEHVFTPPVVLGHAWAQTVRTLVDGVKQIVDKDRAQTERAACLLKPPAPAAEGPRAPAPPPAVVPVWHPSWALISAVRDGLGPSPLEVGAIGVAPPVEAGRDTRGEHAALLGAQIHLPWMVP